MYAIQQAKQEIIRSIKGAFGKQFTPSIDDIETPPDIAMGDFAFPCFQPAKGLDRNPAELAREIAAKIGPKGMIKKIDAKGPYVNFFLDPNVYGIQVMKEITIAGDKYGRSTIGTGKRVMVEFANLNTHKEVHIGHVRNMALGQATSNLLATVGYHVIPVAYINDLGNNVARCLWAYKKYHDGEKPAKGKENDFLGDIYVEATKKLEENEQGIKEVSEIQNQLESGQGKWVKLWKSTNKWSLDGLKSIFDHFGLRLDQIFLESDLLKRTKKIVQKLIKKGLVVESQGAWVVDLEAEGLGINLLVKSDGTHLYNAKDLALAEVKQKKYNPDLSVYVVDMRQKLVMSQLYATLKKMGSPKQYHHLSYGFVSLPEGAISSREGTIIKYDQFIEQLFGEAEKETRERHQDWKVKHLKEVSAAVGMSALKFFMLRTSPNKDIVFSVDEALAFDGFSGPYLMYTNARAASLLKKNQDKLNVENIKFSEQEVENNLIKALSMYPEVLNQAAKEFDISELAQYLFDLGQAFSTFYATVSVLQEKDEKVRQARLHLVSAVKQVIQNGLGVLGIDTVEEM